MKTRSGSPGTGSSTSISRAGVAQRGDERVPLALGERAVDGDVESIQGLIAYATSKWVGGHMR